MNEKERDWLLQEKYRGKESPEYTADLARLASGEPLAYIIGNIPFLGCTIDLASRPLIPRPETEYWVEIVINRLKKHSAPAVCLDIFAGSGCIGIALLAHLQNASVDFAEKDPAHLEQTKENVALNNIDPGRARYFASDIFEGVPEKQYNYIFANPPYIGAEDMGQVQESVLAWESPEALFAEESGLAFVKKLIRESRNYLISGGILFIEFNTPQKEALEVFLTKQGLRDFSFHKDQYGGWRMLEIALH